MRIFLWLLCLVLLAVIGFGTHLVLQQTRQTASYSATAPAIVVDKRLDVDYEQVHGNPRPGESRRRVISEPIVTFRFEMQGRQITGNSVFPERFRVGGNLGRLFAEAPLDKFEVGQQVTAYYNPDNPTETCLIRRPSIVPYLFLLLPALVVSGLVTYLWRSPEGERIDFKRRKNRWIAVFWHTVGLFSAGHYIYAAGADYGGGALALFGIYSQFGLIPVALALPPTSHSEVVRRIDAGIWGSLLGTFLGFWLGIGIGWLASWLVSASASFALACWGYGIVVSAGLFAIFGLLSKSKSHGRRQSDKTKRKRPSGLRGSNRSRTHKSVSMPRPDGPIPYEIDRRPMPEGDNLETLLPSQIGPFRRVQMDDPDDVQNEQIYAEYHSDATETFSDTGKISVELGVCDSPESAQRGVETSKAEMDAESPEATQLVSLKTEPAFFKSVTSRGAFMAWTRGGYYFSAHARSGEDDLDRFMEAFPF